MGSEMCIRDSDRAKQDAATERDHEMAKLLLQPIGSDPFKAGEQSAQWNAGAGKDGQSNNGENIYKHQLIKTYGATDGIQGVTVTGRFRATNNRSAPGSWSSVHSRLSTSSTALSCRRIPATTAGSVDGRDLTRSSDS